MILFVESLLDVFYFSVFFDSLSGVVVDLIVYIGIGCIFIIDFESWKVVGIFLC